jgi:hypothetical protein
VSCASAEEASKADATRSSKATSATVTEPTVTEPTVTDASTADCDVDESAPEDPPEHVDVSRAIEYDVVPPVSGPHRPQWPDITKTLYVSAERPELGELVHSQEHGWTIVWYDETVNPADLGDIAAEIAIAPKIVIVPWTSADGAAFPAGKHVALTHWEVGTEWRQFCAAADSAAILAFAERHPPTDAHEPSGP